MRKIPHGKILRMKLKEQYLYLAQKGQNLGTVP